MESLSLFTTPSHLPATFCLSMQKATDLLCFLYCVCMHSKENTVGKPRKKWKGNGLLANVFLLLLTFLKKVKSWRKDLEYESQPRWPPGPPQHLQSTSRVSRTAIRGQKRPLACRPHPRLTVLSGYAGLIGC